MKTIPLAPSRPALNNSTLRIPVARAVTRSISRMAPERYFYQQHEGEVGHQVQPVPVPQNVAEQAQVVQAPGALQGQENQIRAKPLRNWSTASTATASRVKVRMTGAL